MIYIRQIFLLPILSLFIFSACAAPTVTKKEAPLMIKPTVTEKKPEIPGNAYYYYMQSHIDQRHNDNAAAVDNLKKAISLDPKSDFLQKELISLYLISENNEKALSIVENMLEDDPENVDALLIMGSIKHKMHDMDAAIAAYKKAVSLDPERKNAFLNLGGMYMDTKDWPKAQNIFESYVEKYPNDYTGHFFLGKTLVQIGDIEKAEAEFNRTIELEPALEEPRFELLNIYKQVRTSDSTSADRIESLFYEILNRNPDNIKAVLEFSLFLIDHGEGLRADVILENTLQNEEAIPEIIQYLIKTYMNEQGYGSVVKLGERILIQIPDNSDLNYLVGLAYHEMEIFDAALKCFNKVSPDSGFYRNAVIHTAYVYQRRGDTKEALKTLEDASQIKPDDSELLLYIGSFYEELNDYANAAKAYEKGISIDSENAPMFFRLGVVLDKLGDKDGTIEKMKKVIALDPNHANALNYLGYTYAEMGINLEAAKTLIIRATTLKPDDGYILDSLGWVYYKMGDFEKALEFLMKAVKIVPSDPVILEHLGDVNIKLGDKKTAKEYYLKSMDNQKEDAEKLKNKLKELFPDD